MGSTFSVRFPLTAETTLPVEQPSPDAILPEKDFGDRLPKVLIVEDNEANSDLIAIYLESQFITEQVGSGNLAVKMAGRESYDLILMDINLGPGINGIEAAKEIRKIKHYEDVPIISVTGYSTEAEKLDILKQGFNDFLPKPFDKASLLTIIKKNLQTTRKL
jgi:two-component system, NarL family, sensor histidine kinase BarA